MKPSSSSSSDSIASVSANSSSSSSSSSPTSTSCKRKLARTHNLEKKITSLLEYNTCPQEIDNERYLACCTLLIRTEPATVRQVLNSHPFLYDYAFQLIDVTIRSCERGRGRTVAKKLDHDHDNFWSQDTLARLGVRIMCSYYDDDDSSSNSSDDDRKWKIPIEGKRHERIVDFFKSRHTQAHAHAQAYDGYEYEWLDVELLQLFTLILKSTIPSSSDSKSTCTHTHTGDSVSIVKDMSSLACLSSVPELLVEGVVKGKVKGKAKRKESKLRENIDSENSHGPKDQDQDHKAQDEKRRNHSDKDSKYKNDRIMINLIETLLGHSHGINKHTGTASTSTSCTLENSYLQSFAHFMAMYASFIQYHGNGNGNIDNPLTSAFILNTIDLLLGRTRTRSHDGSVSSSSDRLPSLDETRARSLIHYAVLSMLSRHLSLSKDRKRNRKGGSTEFSLTREMLKLPVGKLSIAIQKLILLGLSSMTGASLRVPNVTIEGDGERRTIRDDDHANVESMIRTMTVGIVATLIDGIGIDWMAAPSNDGKYGPASTFCTIVNLIVGEQRIVLGRLLDAALSFKDPDLVPIKDTGTSKWGMELISGSSIEEWLEMSQGCTQIGLATLRHMVDLANADDGDSNENLTKVNNIPFNTDTILHIRRSLEDLLDSSVQFLLEDTSSQEFIKWEDCKYACCRYLGAYLSSVNVFDYDKGDQDECDDQSDKGNGKDSCAPCRTTSSITLLSVMRNGIELCQKMDTSSSKKQDTRSQMMIHSPKVLSLFPCIVAALTSCEDARQVTIVRTYLLKDSALSSAIETLLALSRTSMTTHGMVPLESASWCCVMIDCLLDYQSLARTKGAIGSAYVMNTKKVMTHLWSFTKILMEKSQSNIDPSEFDDLLDQCFHCLMVLCQLDGSFMNDLDVADMHLLASVLNKYT